MNKNRLADELDSQVVCAQFVDNRAGNLPASLFIIFSIAVFLVWLIGKPEFPQVVSNIILVASIVLFISGLALVSTHMNVIDFRLELIDGKPIMEIKRGGRRISFNPPYTYRATVESASLSRRNDVSIFFNLSIQDRHFNEISLIERVTVRTKLPDDIGIVPMRFNPETSFEASTTYPGDVAKIYEMLKQ
ncbi:MAG TPA: hypothetical protein PKV16_07525 [Caldisericia bacterium]|nr:hypothetical protein [Caldisericia bacterium]HPI84351.1 hypothetical protein [Caldisericia bacterium]HPQ93617.1 hypothetical protein [Caldisericia bacterium]